MECTNHIQRHGYLNHILIMSTFPQEMLRVKESKDAQSSQGEREKGKVLAARCESEETVPEQRFNILVTHEGP